MKKRLPPFARPLAERIAEGDPPTSVNIHCGAHAWARAETYFGHDRTVASIAHLVFPSDALPTEFDWAVLRGLEVTVLHNPDDPIESIDLFTLAALAAECIRAGARKVYRVDPEYSIKIYVPWRAAA